MDLHTHAHLQLRDIKILQELMEQILVLLRESNTLAMGRGNGEIEEFEVCDSFSQLRQVVYKEMNCTLKLLISLYQLQTEFRSVVDSYSFSDEVAQFNMEKQGTLLTG